MRRHLHRLTLDAVRPVRRHTHGLAIIAATGRISRHLQSWLLHSQNERVAIGFSGAHANIARSLAAGIAPRSGCGALVGATGLWMLLATAIVMATSGVAAWLVLIGVSVIFAIGGLAFGVFTLPLFFAIPSRLLGLLEHDLLQALPLYVLIGTMLNRLPLVDILFRVINRLLRRTTAAPYLAGMGLGALLAPMNGSVGASVAMLARAVQPRLDAQGVPPERSAALICVASTVGVVVPPSLVLILLGDAMMRAHTEAINATRQTVRVINTQDIFHGALLPAAIMLSLFFVVAWWRNRGHAAAADAVAVPLSRADWGIAIGSVLCIGALLTSVTQGYLYAVEGAATGGLVLLLFGLITRTLTRAVFKAILHDTLAITGSLFALLTGATVYTLVLRAFETDLWIQNFLSGLTGGAPAALTVVLMVLALSAFILDAFEIIFVIVPVVIPPLLMVVPNATWVAVLILLVLQASFLLPPFGYAVLMASSVLRRNLSQRALIRSLLPYLMVQALMMLLVLVWPNLVLQSHPVSIADSASAPQTSDPDLQQLFEQQRLRNERDTGNAAPDAK